MKPIVIYLDKHDDEIKLTRKEFEEYINKAYDQGYACGYAEGKKYYPWWSNGTITSNMPQPPQTILYGTEKEYNPDYTKITCDYAPGSTVTSVNSIYPGDNAVEKISDTNSTVFEAVSKVLSELGEK